MSMLIFLNSPQAVNNSMIYYKNIHEIGNRARAGAFSFMIAHSTNGSQVAGVSICPWHGFHVGKNSPLRSE